MAGAESMWQLRERAEQATRAMPRDVGEMTPAQVREIVHELHVHQIELEMQNEELRRAQLEAMREHEHHRQLYEHAPVGYLTLERNGSISSVNRTLAKMLAGDEGHRLVGRELPSLVHRADGDTMEHFRRTLFGQGHPAQAEVRMRCETGDAFLDVLLEGRPIREQDRVVQAQVAVVDIGPRKRAQRAVRKAERVDAMGTLAGEIAHNFNNLLMVVVSSADAALIELPTDSKAARYLHRLKRASMGGASMVQQLLNVGRRRRETPGVWSLNRVLEDSEEMLHSLVGERVQLDVRLEARHACVSCGDGQLDQVVMNLLVNARHAMPGGGTLTLRTRNVEIDEERARALAVRPGPFVVLDVEDTGVGMDAATLERVLEPFFTTKSEGEGTGLGLSAVHAIAREHGGYVEIDSEPGAGTRVQVAFPVSSEPETQPPGPPADAALSAGEIPPPPRTPQDGA